MTPEAFHPDQRQNCQRQAGGYWAFVPPQLPPNLPVDWELVALLSEADRSVAQLRGAGRLLPNPHLLIRPYLRREAVLSSLIEDTHADVDELLLFELEPDEAPPRPSIQELAKRVPSASGGVLDSVFAAPMLSISRHAKRSGESYQNVAKAVAFWEHHGLLAEVTQKQRNRIFAAREILEITRPRPAAT